MRAVLLLVAAQVVSGAPPKDNFPGILNPKTFQMPLVGQAIASATCLGQDQWLLAEAHNPVPAPANAPQIEAWYVNADGQTARNTCISRQLKDAGMEPRRFSAAVPPKLGAGDYDQQMRNSSFRDCIGTGVDWQATATHGTSKKEEMAVRQGVVANWCSHQRLFHELRSSKSDYFLVLEDDSVLDTKKILPVLQDFIVNYKGAEWDMVQIDPFGNKDRTALVGYHKGRPVWKPCMKQAGDGWCVNMMQGRETCAQYYGFHAVLVKKSGLPRIQAFMAKNKAVPVDWLPLKMENTLSFMADVALNPEQANVYTNGKRVSLPAYCDATVSRSSIGAMNLLKRR